MKKILLLLLLCAILTGCSNNSDMNKTDYITDSKEISNFVEKMIDIRNSIKEFDMSGTMEFKVANAVIPATNFESKVRDKKWKLKSYNSLGEQDLYSDGTRLYINSNGKYLPDNRQIPHSLEMINPANTLRRWDVDQDPSSQCPLVKAQLSKKTIKMNNYDCKLLKFGDSDSNYLYREVCIDENTGFAVYMKQHAKGKKMILNMTKFNYKK